VNADPLVASLPRPTGARAPTSPVLIAIGFLIAGAWLAAFLLEVTGHAAALHHHALIEGEDGLGSGAAGSGAAGSGAAGSSGPPPLWLAVPALLLAWQLMIAAMMLPASLRAVGVVATSRLVARPAAAVAGFLAAYSVVWTAFGLAAFVGDIGLHHLVDASPWLADRPWLIQAASLALAGAYQLVPLRRRALEACRHPRHSALAEAGDAQVGFRIGLAHAVDCFVCSWALMLLMFAAGVANLAWMAVLAAVMAYEALSPKGARFGRLVGVVLLALAAFAAIGVNLAC
jgi:predicted metal-binding membrane protein